MADQQNVTKKYDEHLDLKMYYSKSIFKKYYPLPLTQIKMLLLTSGTLMPLFLAMCNKF